MDGSMTTASRGCCILYARKYCPVAKKLKSEKALSKFSTFKKLTKSCKHLDEGIVVHRCAMK